MAERVNANDYIENNMNLDPMRTKAHELLGPCPTCKAPARESCVHTKGVKRGQRLPGTAVHAARIGLGRNSPKTNHFGK